METTEPTMAPDPAPFQKQNTELMAQARAAKVIDEPSFQHAGELLKSTKALAKSIESAFADPKAKAFAAHRSISALETSLLAPLKNVEKLLKNAIGAWQVEEMRKRQAEEAKLAAEAQKRREEAQLQEAMELEASGEKEAAEEVVSRPVPLPVVSLPKPKVEGISTAMVRQVRIVDASKLKREFLIPDEVKIRKLGMALGKDAETMCGEGSIVVEDVPQVRVGR